MFKVHMLPAGHGDCVWIEYGTQREPRYVLIDGGTAPTWGAVLKEHLDGHAVIELLVLTHIDSDHIGGAIPMLEEIGEGTFKDVWFNGWKHLQPGQFLSAKQGEVFSTLLKDRHFPWNNSFGGRPVCAGEGLLPEVTLAGGLKLTILSPTPKELSRLRPKWSNVLSTHGLAEGGQRQRRQLLSRTPNPSTNVDELAATPFRRDTSVPNGTSIAFLAEFKNKAVLFAGDAYATVLHRTVGQLLAQRGLDKLKVEAFKIPHHGSRGNVDLKLLSLLDCKQFLFSCNGDIHQLPDNEAVGRVIHSGPPGVNLVFNYDCARTADWASRELQERYEYTANYGDAGHAVIRI